MCLIIRKTRSSRNEFIYSFIYFFIYLWNYFKWILGRAKFEWAREATCVSHWYYQKCHESRKL